MMGRSLAGAAMLAMLATAVQAQGPQGRPPPPTQGASAPPQAAVAGGAIDPARLALARQIYAQLGDETFASISHSVATALQAGLSRAGGDAAHTAAIASALEQAIHALEPQVIDRSAALWAQDFTATQLQEILAFYQSPTGRAVIEKTPQLAQQMTEVSIGLLPEMIRVVQADYCRSVACTAQETQMFTALQDRLRQSAADSGG